MTSIEIKPPLKKGCLKLWHKFDYWSANIAQIAEEGIFKQNINLHLMQAFCIL